MIALPDREENPQGTFSRSKGLHADYVSGNARCEICGGFGHRLVLANSTSCTACFKKLNMSKINNTNTLPKAYQSFFDISPRLDCGVLKKSLTFIDDLDAVKRRGDEAAKNACGGQLVSEGSNCKQWEYALRQGCPCGVHFVARFVSTSSFTTDALQQGDIVGSSRDCVNGKHVGGTDDPADVMIGRGDVITGIEIALLSMSLGETSLFLIRKDYAWGTVGDGFRVGPNVEYLEYELELIYCLPPLPIMPRGAEADRKREERQKIERKQYKESMGPLLNRILECTADRLTGNALFAVGDYENAKKSYDSGFFSLLVTKDEWEGCEDDPGFTSEMKCEVNKSKSLLHLNRSLVNLKLDRLDAAKWDADRAIDHHRAAGFARIEKPKDQSSLLSPFDPENKQLLRELGELSIDMGSADEKQKDENVGKQVFSEEKSGIDLFVAKALFRKGQALLKQAHGVMKKSNKEYWDVNKVLKVAQNAAKCFDDAEYGMRKAINLEKDESFSPMMPSNSLPPHKQEMNLIQDQIKSSPELLSIAKFKSDLSKLTLVLKNQQKREELEWKKVCKDKIIGGLDAANSKGEKENQVGGITREDVYSDMPELDSDEDDEEEEEEG